MIFIGMKHKLYDKKEDPKLLIESVREKRKAGQVENKESYTKALVDKHQVLEYKIEN